ncbi:carbohydrate-binding module family 50 protein [Trichoderma asperellum CBS 433.97]|uniref:Carbohydrate-binding module family 50 protein n=1 Tax=Trichoderma asperellum (strain ATCC 204424 / CBS 433.97 / NBRC 101777) TaxID=1042311 RepID=A0A2T3YSE3_TRIA4|nr:carbohydrate-binding module family 50 protein [Trichoderma asperellum CBS 433.97]PTB35488.1 carbohydrate-binding module family 50 protein [Trichoderma asperellum CBS 433.97]
MDSTSSLNRAKTLQATCSFAIAASSGDTCDSFAAEWGLTKQTFESLNPGVSCPNLGVGQNYCVVGTVSSAPPSGSSSSSALPAKTSSTLVTSTRVSTTSSSTTSDQPQQTSTAANCNNFYLVQPGDSCPPIENDCNKFYLVKSGDSCATIATSQGTTAANIEKWNPGVGSTCTTLWLGDYICVGV